MPQILNSSENICAYLNRGGKVERIEDNAQRNRIKKIIIGNVTVFEDSSAYKDAVEVDIPLVLRSPSGTLYQLIVDDDGVLSTERVEEQV